MLEKHCQHIANNLVSKYGAPIPWLAILELVLQLLDDCFDNEQLFVQTAKNPTFFQKAVLGVTCRRACRDYNVSTRHSKHLRDELLDCCEHCSEEELCAGFQEAKAAFFDNNYGVNEGVEEDD